MDIAFQCDGGGGMAQHLGQRFDLKAHLHGPCGKGVLQTVGFFPPMVDDPYVFGLIAAANAMRDIYTFGHHLQWP